MDAARHVRFDERAEILFGDSPLTLLITAVIHAVGHTLVLKIAFAPLIANRAIEGMVDQQEFKDTLAGLMHQRRIRADHHAVHRGHGAGGDRLRRAFHLDEAHPAIAGDRKSLMEAEMGNLDAQAFARLHHGRARLDLDFNAVDGELRHTFS